MKKNILFGTILSLVLLVGLSGCEEEHTTYNGPLYIMFSDTLSVLGVENNNKYQDIRISATKVCDRDRTFAVEVIDEESNAIEGVHYEIESNTVTIKAGKLATSVRMRGIYENLPVDVESPLKVKLRLVTPEETHWNLYEDKGLDTQVILQKICPFDINAFTGYAVVTSTFLYSYAGGYNRLIETEVDTTKKNTIILHDYLYDGYDVKVTFTTKDKLNPLIEMEDQPMATTGEAFGTIYGDGMLHIYQPSSMTSYYSSCEKFILQYMTVWVPGMEAGYNTVGTFVNAVEWISDDEARILKQQGF